MDEIEQTLKNFIATRLKIYGQLPPDLEAEAVGIVASIVQHIRRLQALEETARMIEK